MEPERKISMVIFTLLVAAFFAIGGYTVYTTFQITKSFFFTGLYLAMAYISSTYFGIVPFVIITAIFNVILLVL